MTTKTLWCANKTKSIRELPTYTRVTAVKVDEIIEGVENLYQDAEGIKYVVHYNKFLRRYEFTRLTGKQWYES